MKKKYPYEILFEKAPYSSELSFQIGLDIDNGELSWWENMSFSQVIQEVQEIANKYYIGSGWVHAEGIEDGCEHSKRELKELKAVIRHMKRVYQKEVV